MQFITIISALTLGVAAVMIPEDVSVGAPVEAELEARQNCGQITPACASGKIIQRRVPCQCGRQRSPCDLWACPRGRRSVCGSAGTGCVFV